MSSRRRPALAIEQLEERSLMSVLPLDDFGNTFAAAQLLTLPARQTASKLGVIDYAGDADIFRFTTASDVPLTVHLFSGRGTSLDGALILFDQAGNEIARNDNLGADTLDSQVSFRAAAGQTYFLQVSASPFAPPSSAAQNYIVTIEPYQDDYGNTLAGAAALALTASEPARAAGDIGAVGDSDVFRINAPTTGGLSLIAAAGSDSHLDSQLTVFDAAGNQIARNDDNLDTLDSALTMRVQAGEKVYVRVAGSPLALFSTGTGTYSFSAALFADEAGSTPTDFFPLTMSANSTLTQTGTIGAPGDVDVFRFTPAFTGPVVVDQIVHGSLDSVLVLLDSAGKEIARNDNLASGSKDSRLLLNVNAGQEYFLQAGARGASVGNYTLRFIAYTDDAPNEAGNGTLIALDGMGQGERSAFIETAGDIDVFRFVAPITGDLTLDQDSLAGLGFGGQLVVRRQDGREITRQSDTDADGRAHALFSVSEGQTYEVSASAGPRASGAYRLRFGPLTDDFGDTLASAERLTFSQAGTAVKEGILGSTDTDVFRFTAAVSGALAIRLDAVNGSSADPLLTVLDDKGTVLARNDDTGGSLNSRAALEAETGRTYFVQAGTAVFGLGSYRLSIAPYADDASSAPDRAALITLSATALTAIQGQIEVTGDRDLYRFTAAFSGTLVIRQNAAVGSNLDSFLTVLDAGQNAIASDDESGGQHNARANISVTEGATYFVRAAGFDASFSFPASGETGGYTLLFSLASDDFGGSIADAFGLTMNGGAVLQPGEIEKAGDTDFFRFVPAATGGYRIRQRASNSTLDTLLFLYDAAGNAIASNDDSEGSLNSRLNVSLDAGTEYVIRAGGFSNSVGTYTLSIAPVTDDFANTLDAAANLTLVNGQGARDGEIETAGDVDVFRFVAQQTGGLVIRQTARPGSLDSLLTVLEAGGNQIAQNDDSNSTLDSLLLINVVQGETYYLQAGAYGSSSGVYSLSALLYGDDAPNERGSSAPAITPSDSDVIEQRGRIEVAGDTDFYQFTAPMTGVLTIRLETFGGPGFLDTLLRVTDANGLPVVSNDDTDGTLNSGVAFNIAEGQTYFMQASASPQATGLLTFGNYRLVFDPVAPPADDFGNTLATASLLTLTDQHAITVRGSFERPGDLDFFRYAVPETGMVVFRAEAHTAPYADCVLAVFDAAGNILGENDDADGRRDSLLRIFAFEGETLFIRTRAFSSGTGTYRLLIHPGAPYFDDGADALFDAPWYFVGPESPLALTGNLERSWDHDTFAVITESPGRVIFRLTPLGSDLQPLLSVFDFVGVGGPHTTPDGTAIPESTLPGGNFFLYYIDVAAADIGLAANASGYQLSVFYSEDDFSDIITDEQPLAFSPAGETVLPGNIDGADDVDNVNFFAPFTGSLTLRMAAAPGSAVQPELTLLDQFRTPISTASPAGGMSELTVSVQAGQRYYVQMAGAGLGIGDYILQISPAPDEAGGTLETAAELPALVQRVVQPVLINRVDDADLFAFTALQTGDTLVRFQAAAGSALDPHLSVLDAAGVTLGSSDDFAGTLSAQLLLPLQAGETYYVRATASPFASSWFMADGRIGAGTLSVSPMTPISVTSGGLVWSGTVAAPGGADLFFFTAPVTGSLTIRQAAAAPGSLDSFVTLYDAQGRQLAQNNNSKGSPDSELVFNASAGQVFLLEAGASPGAAPGTDTGGYTLSLNVGAPAVGLTVGAQVIALGPNGQGSASGQLDAPGQQQVFRFQARTTGVTSVRNLAGTSGLDSAIYVYDAADQLLASSTGFGAQATFDAASRQTYYVRVAAAPFAELPAQTGSFSLAVAPDDASSSFQNASTLGASTQGSLDGTGDVDLFQFTASITGQVNIDLASVSGSRLNALLAAFDASAASLTADGQGLTFSVAAGQTYFVRVDAGDSSDGKYNLNVSFEETNVPLPSAGDGSPDPATGSPNAGGGSSTPSTPSSEPSASLALFADPSVLEGDSPGLTPDTIQTTDLAQVGDSSSALVAVLLVGGVDEEALMLAEEAEAGVPGLEDWLRPGLDENVDSRAVDPRLSDALFALQAQREAAQFRQLLVDAILPGKQTEVMARALMWAADRMKEWTPAREPDIADLLIPEPLPPAPPPDQSEPRREDEELSRLNPMAAALALTGFAAAVQGLRPRRSRPNLRLN